MSEHLQEAVYILRELRGGITEYREMPCDSLQKRLFGTLSRYSGRIDQLKNESEKTATDTPKVDLAAKYTGEEMPQGIEIFKDGVMMGADEVVDEINRLQAEVASLKAQLSGKQGLDND